MLTFGFVVLKLPLLQRGLRLTRHWHVEDAQRSVSSAVACRSNGVVTLELLDDGRKLGVQRRSASFWACRWARNAILLLLVWRRRGSTSGRRRGSGGTSGRSIRLCARWRGRSSALLATIGCRGADGARVRCGGFALGQNTLLHHQRMWPIKQSSPVSQVLFLFVTNKEAPVRFLDLVVNDVCDALKLARWVYTCKSSETSNQNVLEKKTAIILNTQQFAKTQWNNNVGAYYLETDVHRCKSCYKSQKENKRPASKSLQLPTSITLLTQVIVNRVGLLGEEEWWFPWWHNLDLH